MTVVIHRIANRKTVAFTFAVLVTVLMVAASCGGQGGRHRGQSVQVVNTR